MSFSIVIPSRNLDNVQRCTSAIRESGCSARIIIVDDTEDLHLNHRNIRGFPQTVAGVRPFCFARNVNLGINAAGTDDVFVMNDDALATGAGDTRSQFDDLARAMDRNLEFGICSAAIVGASSAPAATLPRTYPENLETYPGVWDLESIRPISGPMFPFVCVYIPRATINLVGLLEERFEGVYGGEDDDYCYRVRRAGLKLGVYDGCVVDHSILPSTFRPDGRGLDITATKQRFREIHGFEMGTR